jgi:threonine efflux protein
MLDWPAIAAVLSVYIVGVMIPGPNFVAVAHRAVSSTRREALAVVAGIVSVSLIWASCAILGVGIVFAAFPWLAAAVRVAGAAYLVFFGLRLIVQAGKGALPDRDTSGAGGFSRAYLQGFATNIANPKSIAFFAAVFSSAAPSHVTLPTFCAMLLTVAVVASGWYGLVALVLSHGTIAAHYRRAKGILDRLCGGAIVLLGARQLLR